MAATSETRAEREGRVFNGSLLWGIIGGFAVGATAGGLLVAALIEDTNEPTKPFYAAPEPEPGEFEPNAPGGAEAESAPAGSQSAPGEQSEPAGAKPDAG